MSTQSVNSISSLLSSALQKSSQQSNTVTQASSSTDPLTDVVSLSSALSNTEREALLSTEFGLGSPDSTGSGDSLYNVLLGGSQGTQESSDELTAILMGAENARLMEANPALMKDILSVQTQTQGTDSTQQNQTGSSSIDTETLANMEGINLLAMDPNTLLSILQRSVESQNSGEQNESVTGPVVNKTV